MNHQLNCISEWILLLLQLLRVHPHIVYKSQLVTESDMTVHLMMQFTSMLKDRSDNLKKMLLARGCLGNRCRYIAIWSQIILLTTRQNGSKLRWENCSHYPKVRLDKQTLLFLPLTSMCLGGPLGSRGSQKFHCQ